MSGLEAHIVVRRDEHFEVEVELKIEPGQTVVLLGPNGAGKSTLVECLAGIVALDAGQIRLDGVPLDDSERGVFVPSEDRHLGIVFQDYLLFDHLSVTDNVSFGPISRGVDRRAAHRLAQDWLEAFDLDEMGDRRPPELSGGQAQRVALARALAAEPALLLLDEPLAALDATTHARLRRMLATHLDRCAAPRLLITHDPTDAFLLADKIYVLEDGKVTQVGTPDEIRRHPATSYVADVAGTNLFSGICENGEITIAGTEFVLHAAHTGRSGPVLATVHPRAIALHAREPHGSPRNTWRATVEAIDPLGDITRVLLAGPIRIAADITPAAATALELRVGGETWVAVKATEVDVSGA